MSVGSQKAPSAEQLLEENEALRQRLEEAEQTIEAIRHGEVDALVVVGPRGEQVYSLTGAEHIYRVIVETMHEAALTADPDGTILFCNQRFCDLMRTPMREVLGRKIAAFADASQQPVLETVLADAQARPVQHHLALRAADGTVVPVLVGAHPLVTDDGTSICLVASDLTALEDSAHSIRVLREQRHALAESEERLRLAAQAAHFGVYCIDLVKDHLYWSPEMREIVGLTDEMPTPQTLGAVPDFIHPNDLDAVRRLIQAAYDPAGDGIVHSEHRIVRPDGTVRWVLLKGQVQFEGQGANRRPAHSSGVMLDITERKRTEEVMRISAQRFRALVTASSQGLYRMNPDWSEMRQLHSRGFLANTEKPNRNWFEQYIPAEEQSRVIAAIREAVRTRSVFELEHQVYRVDGSMGWTFSRAVPLTDANGDIVEWFGAAADVTKRKNAEEALRRAGDLADALNRISEAVHSSLDANKILQRLVEEGARALKSETAAVSLRRSNEWVIRCIYRMPDDLIGTVMTNDRERHAALALETGRPVAVDDAFNDDRFNQEHLRSHNIRSVLVVPLIAHSETLGVIFFNYHSACHRFTEEEVRFAYGLAASASIALENARLYEERKHAERALRELNATLEARVAERTAEVEQRARQLQMLAMELSATEARERKRLAEILHDDLQQQLAGTKFHVTLLGKRLGEDGETRKMVKQIEGMIKEAIHSSRSLSHELSPAVLYRSDLCETFEWMAEEMRSKHGLVIHVAGREVSLESDALKAFVYKAGQELLFNVVKHARVNEAWVRLRRVGPCIGLMVCDRGRGFEPAALSDATGFGLLSIRERVELLGGRMKIRSKAGVGSRFVITVPDRELAEAATELETVKQVAHIRPEEEDWIEMAEEASGTVIRVVIADDHEIVRQGLAALFEEEPDIELVGEAGNGREAVDVTHQTRPDVVIMDVSMPLMSGEEATRQIKAYVPGTRVIALSMFGDPVMAAKMRRVGAETYLCKTDASETLLAAIRGHSTQAD